MTGQLLAKGKLSCLYSGVLLCFPFQPLHRLIKLLQHLLNILLRINLRDPVAFHAKDFFDVFDPHIAVVQNEVAGEVSAVVRGDFPADKVEAYLA